MFRMIGYGENVGSGFPYIINAWRENNRGDPALAEQTELMQVKLRLGRTQMGAKGGVNVPKDVPKDVPKEILDKLTDRQREIISLVQENCRISRKEMSLKMSVSSKTVARDIEGIRKHLRLDFVGGKATGHWEVACFDS